MTKTIIGIDFSLNSPAWCLLSEERCLWGSLHRTEKNIDRMLSSETAAFGVLSKIPQVSVQILQKSKIEGDYCQSERKKIENYLLIADVFVGSIEPYLNKETVVFMEGISFGSSGNSLIDISMCTSLVRERIVNLVGFKNLNIYSPTSIKKYALKGNSKKNELYLAILDKHRENKKLEPLLKVLEQNKDNWIKKSGDVESPCSDLIDATWISLFGMSILGETF
jgi:hypothetical protein